MGRMRLLLWNCLIMIMVSMIFVIPSGNLEAAPQQVNIQVEPGWKGEYKGGFVPVRVRLSAGGGSVSGEVSVELPNQKWSQQKPAVYPLEKVELPAGATKEITMIVPNELARPDAVVVFKAGNKVIASQILGGRRLGTFDLAIGALSDDPHLAATLHQTVASGLKNASVHTYPLHAKEIPDQGRALSGFDVIVINRLASESLTPAQIKAIYMWVNSGGKLVIGGGHQGPATARGLESLLPVELTGKTISVSSLDSFSAWGAPPKGTLAISQSRLKEGSWLLAASRGEILLAHRDLGQGKVFYAGYDLATQPMIGWPGNKKLWGQELFYQDSGQDTPDGNIQTYQLWELRSALNQMPHLRLPKMGTLIAVFTIYLLIVGPMVYWIFARMKKHEWNWLAVPLIGILVTIGLFLYGNHLRGNAVLIHNIGIVHADEGGNAAVYGATAMVSQEADDYVLKAADGFAWPMDSESSTRRSASDEKGVSFHNGASILFRDVPQWSKRDAYVEQVQHIGGNLTGTIRRENHQFVGEVRNGTRLKLKQVRVIMGDQTLLIGNLPPGATKRFTVSNSPAWQARLQPERMGLKGRELQLYSYWLNNRDSEYVSHLDVIGWTEDPVLHIGVDGRKMNQSNLYLVNGTMSMKADATGKLTLPFGVIPSRILSDQPIYGNRHVGSIAMNNSGTLTFEYSMHPYKFTQIDRLEVKTASGKEEIYNWQQGQWQPVSAMNRQSPSSYISSDQRLRIRVNLKANQMTGKPMIEVEGRVKE